MTNVRARVRVMPGPAHDSSWLSQPSEGTIASLGCSSVLLSPSRPHWNIRSMRTSSLCYVVQRFIPSAWHRTGPQRALTQQFVEGQTDERLRAAKPSAVRLKALAHVFFVLPVHTRAARRRCVPKLLEEETALEKR